MSTTKINSAQSLRALIEEAIKASLYNKSLQEKEKQAQQAPSEDDLSDEDYKKSSSDLFGDDDTGGDTLDAAGGETNNEPQTSKTTDDETEKMKKGEVEVKDIVEKLNTIRSGKSFKDDSVKKNMEEYINSLKVAERTALFTFLKGIAQITTGEIQAQAAIEPQDNPANVEMKKGEDIKTKHVKPNVIKTAAQPQQQQKKPQEDSSGPVPITPKKK